nr:hypothetical protein B0A51_00036 [Rachicladosporium sp. CCFEE 5018]
MCKASATDIDEPEWIGGDPRYHTVFETLVGFIAKAAENATERDELVDATIAILLSVGTQDPSMDEYKLDSLALFGILLTIVKQIDAATARHNAAVKLVMAIRNAPPPSSVLQTTDRYDRNREVHLQLTTFIGALSSFELDAPLHPCLEDRPSTIVPSSRPPWRLPHYQRLKPSEWASLNAFIAKVHAAESDILELDYRGLFAMIEALEEPRTESELEDVLPAATARIVYAGSALKINDFPYACYPTESKRMPWSRGRFREIAGREDVSDAVRSTALKAVEAGSGA